MTRSPGSRQGGKVVRGGEAGTGRRLLSFSYELVLVYDNIVLCNNIAMPTARSSRVFTVSFSRRFWLARLTRLPRKKAGILASCLERHFAPTVRSESGDGYRPISNTRRPGTAEISARKTWKR